MSVPSAEIAKMGLNVAVVAKIARANEIALLCHHTPGADADDVLDVIGRDGRIGQKFFSAGPPPGGPCFPRDSSAMRVAMRRVGIHPHVTAGVYDFDRYLVKRQASIAASLLDPEGRKAVGILGLTYKPGVSLTVGSPGLWLAEELRKFLPRPDVYGYDPALPAVRINWDTPEGTIVECVAGLEELVESSDVLVLATTWKEFLSLYDMNLMDKDVVDLWGFLPGLECRKYVRFGHGY
jgi:UDPglucose 6-dehydrogenase